MSKYIRFTDEMIEKIRQDFETAIASVKMVGGEFTFKRTLSDVSAKATLRFTCQAYRRMAGLVRTFDKEVAWNMVAERGEAENEYIITDILVYPQTVTSATVDRDSEEYARWIQAGVESGDERFFGLYGQGHSHVNMSTSPSGTDLSHQSEILKDLRPTGFYVFVIWNKRDEHTAWIYDLGKNICFENKDITVVIGEQDDGYEDFIKGAKELVKTAATVSGGVVYGTKTWPATGVTQPATQTKQPAKPAETMTNAAKQEKKKEKVRAVVTSAPKTTYSHYEDYICDDGLYDDGPTSPFFVRDNYFGSWR